MREIQAPNPIPFQFQETMDGEDLLFLAGSIEMGKAENWQDKVKKALQNENYVILNPRRDDWDSSWVQSIDHPQFKEQVTWELTAQDVADIILMYFDPSTKAPISLLELGLYAKSGKKIASYTFMRADDGR